MIDILAHCFLGEYLREAVLVMIYVVVFLLSTKESFVKHFTTFIILLLSIYVLNVTDFIRLFVSLQLLAGISFFSMAMSSEVKAGSVVQLLKFYILTTLYDVLLLFAIYAFYVATNSLQFGDAIIVESKKVYALSVVLFVLYFLTRAVFVLFSSDFLGTIKKVSYKDVVCFVFLPMLATVASIASVLFGLIEKLPAEYVLIIKYLISAIIIFNSVTTALLSLTIKDWQKLGTVVLANSASFIMIYFLVERSSLDNTMLFVLLSGNVLPLMGHLYFSMHDSFFKEGHKTTFFLKGIYLFFVAALSSLPLTISFSTKLNIIIRHISTGAIFLAAIVVISSFVLNYGIYNLSLSDTIVFEKSGPCQCCNQGGESGVRKRYKEYFGLGLLALIILIGGIIQIAW